MSMTAKNDTPRGHTDAGMTTLREVVEAAFREGWRVNASPAKGTPEAEGEFSDLGQDASYLDACETEDWRVSKARAALAASPAPAASAGGEGPVAWVAECFFEGRWGSPRITWTRPVEAPFIRNIRPLYEALAPAAAPSGLPGREEIADAIYAHVYTSTPDVFTLQGVEDAADAILAARPVADGVAAVVEDVRDPDLHDARWMRLKNNPGVAGPVIEECEGYITIEHLTTDRLTRTPDAFEPCPSPYAATAPTPPTDVDPAGRPGASAIKDRSV